MVNLNLLIFYKNSKGGFMSTCNKPTGLPDVATLFNRTIKNNDLTCLTDYEKIILSNIIVKVITEKSKDKFDKEEIAFIEQYKLQKTINTLITYN